MSRSGLKSIFSLYTPTLSSFRFSQSPFSSITTLRSPSFHFPSFKLSRQNLFNAIVRYLTTSSHDNLDGLVDTSSDILRKNSFFSDKSPPGTHFAEEISILRGALVDSGPDFSCRKGRDEPGKCSNDAVLILDVIRNNNDGFGNDTKKSLRQFREKLNESLVVEVLNNAQNPELGVKFFLWAGRQICYSHTVAVYNALLDLLQCGKDDRIPESFLQEIKKSDNEVLGKLLNFLIKKCSNNGMWNLALEELGRLKDFGYKPTRTTYNALIHVFLKANRLDTAFLLHREMSDMGLNMDCFTLGYFTHSLCKSGRWKEALALIEKEEFVPDTAMYTKMISGLCEASLFEEAMDFLNRMRSSSCIPNVVTYKILLSACLNKRQLGRCKRILSMMIMEGCYPSSKIFNSLVHAYCRSGEYSYAYKLLKKMVSCGCEPGYVVYNILIGGICGNEELPSSEVLELAEKAYCEMKNAGFVLNKINVSNFARCLCGEGKFEQAYNVIREMMSKGFIPDTSTYSKVIGFLCNASEVEKAFLLFNEMKRHGVVPDVFTYTILIDSFCKAGLIQQAQIWFDEMKRVGCAPNVVTYTTLIHAYLKARKVSRANEVYEMMLSEGCIPNIVTYTALIDGHCKAGEIQKACQIYSRMKRSEGTSDIEMYFKVDNDENSSEPNIFTYGALVDGLCKAHKVKEAHDLLNAMTAEGCEPNHVVYDSLIDGFCKIGKLDEAQDVFSTMSERGYSPNVYTYSSLIDRMFKDKRLDLALKVLSKMLENSCTPNVIIYTEMVDGLCKVGKTDEAYKLMSMMEDKGCRPNVVTYTAMIDGFGKVGKVDKCLELLRQMNEKGCAPNFVTYRVLVNHCCASGLLDQARELLEEMKHTYWPKDLTGHRKVIEGFKREFILSLGILDGMGKEDSAPIVAVYMVLIDSFCKAGRLEMALEMHDEISSSYVFSPAHSSTYSSLIESLSLANRVDKAIELYAEMIKRGGLPDLSMLFHLVKGLIKDGKWEEALQFSDSICQMDLCFHTGDKTSEEI